MTTTACIVRCARRLQATAPGFLAAVIAAETGEDYAGRNLLDRVARLIEIFGVAGAGEIVGCP